MNLIKVAVLAMSLFLASIFQTNGQTKKTGDKLPGNVFTNLLNYKSPSLRFSDFKGKAIIIDFWNTYCTSCIKAFPKIDSLQKYFKDNLQILLVNSESREKTIAFFNKHKNIVKPDVPMITGDKLLKSLFPSEGQPYIVWVDRTGSIKNFSSVTNFSATNIKSLIEGEQLLFRDPTNERHGSAVDEKKFEFVSYISNCYESLNIGNSELQEINDGKSVTITSNCASIVALFKKAFSEFGKYNLETSYAVDLNVKDTFKYVYPHNIEEMDKWLNNYAFNYQVIVPESKKAIAYSIMQRDLLDYFDLNARVCDTTIGGLIIKKENTIFNQTKGHQKYLRSYAEACPDSVIIFNNQPFEKISEYFKTRFTYFFPYVDKSGYSGNVSLIIRKSSLSPYNHKAFLEDIACAGFAGSWEKVYTKVLSISDRY